jgi:hypothetical protein
MTLSGSGATTGGSAETALYGLKTEEPAAGVAAGSLPFGGTARHDCGRTAPFARMP